MYDGDKYYHRVPGILVPKEGTTYAEINSAVNNFIDTVPGLIESIEDDFSNLNTLMHRNSFISKMGTLSLLLRSIFARWLEADAVRLLSYVKEDSKIELTKKALPVFVMDVISISLSLQKAQSLEKVKNLKPVSVIEIQANIARSLATAKDQLNSGEYEDARTIISELAEYNHIEDTFTTLLNLLDLNLYDDVKTLINTMLENSTETIDELAGTDFSKLILAVDDMPETLIFVKNTLKSHYNIIAVPGPNIALKALEKQKPDLFLLDIDMPKMDGFELAERIRAIPEYSQAPLIFLTGNSTREHISRAMKLGCDGFIVKPSSHEYLLTEVGKLLNP